jgi:hypothetical protein
VQHRQHQGADAQPFVQPVHLVQPAQPSLKPARPDGQQQRRTHHADGQHTAVLHHHCPQCEIVERLRRQRIGQQPEAGQQQKQSPQAEFDRFHDVLSGYVLRSTLPL